MNGYQIIDLKDTTISETGTKVSGVFESIKNSNRKPLLVTGIVIDGTEIEQYFFIDDYYKGKLCNSSLRKNNNS